MEKTVRVVMIDDNESVVGSVRKYFWSNAVIKIVKTFSDGKTGLDYLINNSEEYDLVILDVLLPNIDGIKILEELKNNYSDKKTIVISSFKDDYTIRQIQDLNVNYFLLKPFDITSLEKRINDIVEDNSLINSFNQQNVEIKVSKLLHDLGIPSHVRGYQYIRDGIIFMFDNKNNVTLMTKELYPELAEKHDTTVSRVERAIRHAIEISWLRGDIDLMESLFGHSIDLDRAKPTNSEFLTTIADHLKLNRRQLVR